MVRRHAVDRRHGLAECGLSIPWRERRAPIASALQVSRPQVAAQPSPGAPARAAARRPATRPGGRTRRDRGPLAGGPTARRLSHTPKEGRKLSTSIDQAFIKQFEEEVHQAYQRMGSKLRNTVRVKNGVRGSSTVFQKVGKGSASTKARHGMVPVMTIDHNPVECQLLDFYAGDWVDRLDELKINIDERQVVANAGAFALGRKTDEHDHHGARSDHQHRRLRHRRPDQGQGARGVRDVRREGRARRRPALRRDRLETVVGPARDHRVRERRLRRTGRAAVARHPGQALAGHAVVAAFRPRAQSRRASLLLVPPQRHWPCHRPGGDHRHHLARRPGRALRVQFDEPGRLPDRRRRVIEMPSLES